MKARSGQDPFRPRIGSPVDFAQRRAVRVKFALVSRVKVIGRPPNRDSK
jgi:hypothetical protein